MALLGAHCSIAGGYHNAVLEAVRAGCDVVQVFTKNNNQWRAKAITDEDVKLFRGALAESRVSHPVAHSSYLINLASPDEILRQKSIEGMVTELTRAEMQEIYRYAESTRATACDGCDHICGAAIDVPLQIGSTLRYLMYHDVYGKSELARELYARLPREARSYQGIDLRKLAGACPHGVDIPRYLRRAAEVLV